MSTIRHILPSELDLVRAHLLRLERDDRVLRFFGQASDATIERHCAEIDWTRACLIGCFVEGTLRGVAELQLDRPLLPQTAELAVSVEKPWQKQGLGTALLRHALVVARNRAVPKLVMLCLLDNVPMQHVAKKFGDELHFNEGEVEVDVRLPMPTPVTLWQEAVSTCFGLIGTWLEKARVGAPANDTVANDPAGGTRAA